MQAAGNCDLQERLVRALAPQEEREARGELYAAKLREDEAFVPGFSLEEAIQDGCAAAGRKPECKESLYE
jgi:hypothetical protein